MWDLLHWLVIDDWNMWCTITHNNFFHSGCFLFVEESLEKNVSLSHCSEDDYSSSSDDYSSSSDDSAVQLTSHTGSLAATRNQKLPQERIFFLCPCCVKLCSMIKGLIEVQKRECMYCFSCRKEASISSNGKTDQCGCVALCHSFLQRNRLLIREFWERSITLLFVIFLTVGTIDYVVIEVQEMHEDQP